MTTIDKIGNGDGYIYAIDPNDSYRIVASERNTINGLRNIRHIGLIGAPLAEGANPYCELEVTGSDGTSSVDSIFFFGTNQIALPVQIYTSLDSVTATDIADSINANIATFPYNLSAVANGNKVIIYAISGNSGAVNGTSIVVSTTGGVTITVTPFSNGFSTNGLIDPRTGYEYWLDTEATATPGYLAPTSIPVTKWIVNRGTQASLLNDYYNVADMSLASAERYTAFDNLKISSSVATALVYIGIKDRQENDIVIVRNTSTSPITVESADNSSAVTSTKNIYLGGGVPMILASYDDGLMLQYVYDNIKGGYYTEINRFYSSGNSNSTITNVSNIGGGSVGVYAQTTNGVVELNTFEEGSGIDIETIQNKHVIHAQDYYIMDTDNGGCSESLYVGNTLYVSKRGQSTGSGLGERENIGYHFSEIADAIAAANVGDTIQIYPGTYYINGAIAKDGVLVYCYKGVVITGDNLTSGLTGSSNISFMGHAEINTTTPMYCYVLYGISNHCEFECDSINTTSSIYLANKFNFRVKTITFATSWFGLNITKSNVYSESYHSNIKIDSILGESYAHIYVTDAGVVPTATTLVTLNIEVNSIRNFTSGGTLAYGILFYTIGNSSGTLLSDYRINLDIKSVYTRFNNSSFCIGAIGCSFINKESYGIRTINRVVTNGDIASAAAIPTSIATNAVISTNNIKLLLDSNNNSSMPCEIVVETNGITAPSTYVNSLHDTLIDIDIISHSYISSTAFTGGWSGKLTIRDTGKGSKYRFKGLYGDILLKYTGFSPITESYFTFTAEAIQMIGSSLFSPITVQVGASTGIRQTINYKDCVINADTGTSSVIFADSSLFETVFTNSIITNKDNTKYVAISSAPINAKIFNLNSNMVFSDGSITEVIGSTQTNTLIDENIR